MPLTAISIFSAMVERAARAPLTRLRPTSGRGVVVATTSNATVPGAAPTPVGV